LEMMGADVHAAVQIETVSRETLDTGIKGKIIASLFCRVLDQPVEKRRAEPARAVGLMGNEVVDVKSTAGEKEIENTKPATERTTRSSSRYAS